MKKLKKIIMNSANDKHSVHSDKNKSGVSSDQFMEDNITVQNTNEKNGIVNVTIVAPYINYENVNSSYSVVNSVVHDLSERKGYVTSTEFSLNDICCISSNSFSPGFIQRIILSVKESPVRFKYGAESMPCGKVLYPVHRIKVPAILAIEPCSRTLYIWARKFGSWLSDIVSCISDSCRQLLMRVCRAPVNNLRALVLYQGSLERVPEARDFYPCTLMGYRSASDISWKEPGGV